MMQLSLIVTCLQSVANYWSWLYQPNPQRQELSIKPAVDIRPVRQRRDNTVFRYCQRPRYHGEANGITQLSAFCQSGGYSSGEGIAGASRIDDVNWLTRYCTGK
jgi:hypothetical protein